MPDWKILITDGLEESGLSILRLEAQVDQLQEISAEDLAEQIEDYDALIVRSRTRVTSDVVEAGRKLKVIGRAGACIDNIDLAAANRRKITVVNAPLAATRAIAELTIGLIFALARAIPQADAGMKSGLWLKDELVGIELSHKVLGIIGLGRIGGQVARLAAGLGMTILGYDPFLSNEEIKQRGVEPTELRNLLNLSDFVSLHVPLSPETRNLINGKTIGLFKHGARLICTARGGLIDEMALLGGLESGQVGGAALDVFAIEPPGMSALACHPKVVATPHLGAQTLEAQKQVAIDIAEEVLAALQGKPLRWKII